MSEGDLRFLGDLEAMASEEGAAVCFDAIEYVNGGPTDHVSVGILSLIAGGDRVAIMAKWGEKPTTGILVGRKELARLLAEMDEVRPAG